MWYTKLIASVLLVVFTFAGCSDDDSNPCDNVECANGGECVKGDCNCTKGYEGMECKQEKTPRSMQITEVRISDFPLQTSDGEAWDIASSFPDVYFVMGINNRNIVSTNYVEEAGNQTLTFNSGFPVNINNPTSQYTLGILDYDSTSDDDAMDGANFTPYKKGNGFPSTISMTGKFGTTFKLDVEYNF
jgi:hypothetical protein